MRLEWAVTRRVAAIGDADRDLVERMASGDEAALADLYVSHGRRLLAYAIRLTGSRDVADEVVVDALLAAWRSPNSFRGEGTVGAWLLGIVRNRSLNAVRRKRIVTTTLDEASHVSTNAAPDADLETREDAHSLRAALTQLSDDHREVVELVFFHGLSLADVASVCGCPVGTVKSRLHGAKSRLRQILERAHRESRR